MTRCLFMCDVDFAIFRHPNRICRWWRPISGHQLERQEIFQFRHTTQGTSVWMTHGDFQSSILHTTYDQISVTATIVVHTFSSYWEIQISSIEGNFLFKKKTEGSSRLDRQIGNPGRVTNTSYTLPAVHDYIRISTYFCEHTGREIGRRSWPTSL